MKLIVTITGVAAVMCALLFLGGLLAVTAAGKIMERMEL